MHCSGQICLCGGHVLILHCIANHCREVAPRIEWRASIWRTDFLDMPKDKRLGLAEKPVNPAGPSKHGVGLIIRISTSVQTVLNSSVAVSLLRITDIPRMLDLVKA